MPPVQASFDLKMGKDHGLRVGCGDEPMQACIEAAQPLMDRLEAMGGSRRD